MNKISIIHYQPVEWYPPVMNMLNYLAENYQGNIHVYTHGDYRSERAFEHERVRVFRLTYPHSAGKLKRMISYVRFITRTFLALMSQMPDHVLYYETNSALPVYFYFLFRRSRKSRLHIHYHEYNTFEQYKEGMKLVYYSYQKEKSYLWKIAGWISLTNEFRVQFFKEDYPFLENVHLLPNYPPASWYTGDVISKKPEKPVRLVYVGSLGMENFYIKEICEWILKQEGNAILDIYTQNSTEEVNEYIETLPADIVRLYKGGVWYYDLPEALKEYDVGLILYKDFNKNFIYNETNKLFEYLTLGMDVWFSEDTKGIYKYIEESSYPKIIKLDFNKLDKYKLEELINRSGLKKKEHVFQSEAVYKEFLDRLT